MFATPYTALNSSWLEDVYDYVKSKKETYGDKYHYYGNTLRLLSLLYLSGRMANLYKCEFGPIISGTFQADRYLPGYYHIKNVETGQYLTHDAFNELTLKQGGDVMFSQRWRFVEARSSRYSGWYKIISDKGYKITSHLPNTNLTLEKNSGGQPILWWMHDRENDGTYLIRSRVDNQYRIYANSGSSVQLSTNWRSGKYFEIIPAGN
jgi:hypothetical protein